MLLASGIALAQPSTATGALAATHNNGIKFGEGRLHPFIDLALHFDSAAGFFNAGGVGAQLSPELILHVRPGLRLDVPAPWLDLTLAGFADYLWYTGALTPGSQAASRLQAGAELAASFNRRGAVEVQVGDTFQRSDRTRNPAVGVGVLSLYNEVRLGVPIHPGGGALEFTPRGAYAVEFFQPIGTGPTPGCADPSCDPAQVASFNYQNAHAALTAKWRFLPKTAALFEGSYDGRRYFNPGNNLPADVFRVSAGLVGLITTKLSVTAKAGWARDIRGSGGAAFIAHAEVGFLPSETIQLKLGYIRTLDPVPLYGSMRDDRPYFEGRALLAGALSLRAYIAYDWLTFFRASGRVDQAATVDLGPEYQFTSWFVGALGYTLSTRASNTNPAASFNYTRHEAYARISFVY